MYDGAHVCGIEKMRLEQGETRSGLQEEDRRGRIGASEAEASLLGDYGSLIPIQRSELHAERKSRPPESRGVSCGERLKPPAPPSPLVRYVCPTCRPH